MTCGDMACGNEDKFYSLAPEATSDFPKSIEELVRWLSEQDEAFRGKLYVASSVKWNGYEFVQDGCSPCYLEKRWSLACCKHDMRSSQPFRKQIQDSHRPYFIFTLASNKGFGPPKGGQALVSIARVTESFKNMQDYARFLCQQSQAIKLSRLTRQPTDENYKKDWRFYKGWRFGDCHADDEGEIGPPDKDHEHSGEEDLAKDLDRNGLILFSDNFLIWEEPKIISRETIRQDRWGRDISPDTLGKLLKNR